MKKTTLILITTTLILNVFSQSNVCFVENKGQINHSDILFSTRSENAHLFLTNKGLKYQFTQVINTDHNNSKDLQMKPELRSSAVKVGIIDMEFVNSNPEVKVEPDEKISYYENFYLSGCPGGILKVPSYKKIVYKELYPHIDWVIYIKDDQVKYDLIVKPGGKIEDIKMKYSGSDALKINENGALEIKSEIGKITELKPFSYDQQTRIEIKSMFKIENNNVGFLMDVVDPQSTIVIDPIIVWSSYYGTNNYDDTHAGVTADGFGSIYFGGNTSSPTGIAINGFQDSLSYSGVDAYLVKMDESGNRKWATYYGGNGLDVFYDISANGNNLYVTGTTNSTDVVAYNGFQNIIGADTTFISGYWDAMLIKFDTSGSRIWGTYIGDEDEEQGYGVVGDDLNNVYVTGYTTAGMPLTTFNGFQTSYGGGDRDAFVAKFNPSGTLNWISYYGGNGTEFGGKLALDTAQSHVYLTGSTTSASGIASGGFQNTPSVNGDAMIIKFDASGNRIWSTYYGGNGSEWAGDIEVDNQDNFYTAISTTSTNGVAVGGQITTITGTTDDLVLKMDASGNRLWASYFPAGDGAPTLGAGTCLAIDQLSNAYLTGCTSVTTGISCNGFQTTYGGGFCDSYVCKFGPSGNILWSSYFGGTGDETSTGCGYSTLTDHVYICGYTNSTTNIAFNGYLNTNAGINVGYVTQITSDGNCNFGIEESQSSLISVFPNPTDGKITVRSEEEISYTITNTIGQIIYTGKATNTNSTIDLSIFPGGIYTLTFGNNEYKKIIKY